MKTIYSAVIILFLPFFTTAQSGSTQKAIEKILEDVPMGISLDAFLKRHTNATLDATSESRVEYIEKGSSNGIKEITYYFGSEDNKPFYEVIVELDDEALRAKVSKQFFGEFNHPSVTDHWVIYKGDKDVLTVGWVYEAKFIYVGKVPNTSYFSESFFNLQSDFKNIDKRINKSSNASIVQQEEVKPKHKENEEIKPNTTGTLTCEDYGSAITSIFDANIKLKMAADTLQNIFPKAKLDKNSPDFRDEYRLSVNKNGLKEVLFYTAKKDNNPLYEIIFEFENADTVLRLAEIMFPNLNHPSLDNHWILNIGEKKSNGVYAVSMAWVYENRLILAGNLPHSEWDDDNSFQLPEDFVNAYFKKEGIEPQPNKTDTDNAAKTDENEATSLVVNNLIATAAKDFEGNKTELMPNKKEEYNAASFVSLGQEQAVVRKNAAGNWRLEVRFSSYATADEAKNTLENTIAFYQTLEGLEYRLVKKSDLSTANGRTYIWDIQSLDDQSTGIILKWQSYPTSNGQFGIKMELGK
jgi:hypothetical protein